MSRNQLYTKAIVNALGAHGAWKLRLRTTVATGNSAVTPSQAKCDKSCEFGQWLYGPSIDDDTRRGMPYKVVSRLHREFHESASNVLAEANANRREAANSILEGEFKERSEKLARALNKWRSELANA